MTMALLFEVGAVSLHGTVITIYKERESGNYIFMDEDTIIGKIICSCGNYCISTANDELHECMSDFLSVIKGERAYDKVI